MKALFKDKSSRLGSLISLIAVTAMLAFFWLALPEFMTSTVGRFFAAGWAILAIVVFLAHARRVRTESPRQVPFFAKPEELRLKAKSGRRSSRFLRG